MLDCDGSSTLCRVCSNSAKQKSLDLLRLLPSHLIGLHWPALHVQIPDLHGQVVSGHHVAPIVAKLNIRDGGYDLGEEGTIAGIFWLLKH